MKSLTLAAMTIALSSAAFAQAGGDKGPERIVWAAQKVPETPYDGVNKPVTHIADILKKHAGHASWEEKVMLTRDYDGRYISLAPGEKTQAQFYSDDRAVLWVYSGQMKVTIEGQAPTVATKGYLVDVAPRLAYAIENTGSEPVVFWRLSPAGQMPSYPVTETPPDVKGWRYIKAKITFTGGYETPNQPFLDFNKDIVAVNGKSRDFAMDGHTSAHIIRGGNLAKLPPDSAWGHFHENMVEAWVIIEGQLSVKISGEKNLAEGVLGDVILAPNERWHRASCTANTGPCTRLAMTPRYKEGQVHYEQADAPVEK